MGRRPNVPQLDKAGVYKCWHPAIKKYISLGTSDYSEACRIQAGFYPGGQAFQGVSDSTSGSPVVAKLDSGARGNDEGTNVIDFDKSGGSTDAGSLLSKWATAGQTPATEPSPPATPVETQPSLGTQIANLFGPTADQTKPTANPAMGSPGGRGKAKASISPEQAAKLASGLKKIVTNLNVIVVGAGVQMFGRVPAPLDDDEVAMLQMGWEMYIDELFQKSKIKPWHVLAAGNVMIAAAMYVGGTPIKKQLPAGPDKAKSATVTPIDGGKKDA